ncbi:MAG: META and DUF4377 domain-containing protein [Luteimonas sp.]|nr:META and DUF4377 domain-containing protein [Luteimonas sp.]
MRPAPLLLPLALVLAACAPSNPPAESPPPAAATEAAPAATTTPQAALDAQALAASHWRLADAVDGSGTRIDVLLPGGDHVLQLDFADGRLSVDGGCNRMNGAYTLDGDRFSVGPMVQTKKFCGEPLMATDAAIARILGAGGTLSTDADGALALATAAGERLVFAATPTADTRFGGPGERVFLEVAPERVACHHPLIPDFRCLHVREVRYDDKGLKTGTGEWQFLYDDIEGYAHEPGVRNVLRLKRYTVPNPPADGSSIAYVLDMVVESEVVKPAG